MDRLGRLWPHAEPVEHTLGRLGARSARAARGGEMSRIIKSDDGTFDVDVACRPVRTLHVKDGVSLVVFTTVVPYHPRRPTDLDEADEQQARPRRYRPPGRRAKRARRTHKALARE